MKRYLLGSFIGQWFMPPNCILILFLGAHVAAVEGFSQDDCDRVYQEMYRRIEDELRKGHTVIQDAGNFNVFPDLPCG